MQKYNYTPPAQAGQPKSWYDQVQEKVGQQNTNVSGPSNSSTSVVGDVSKDIPSIIKNRGAAVAGNISGDAPESQGENAVVRGVQATGNAFGAVTDIGGSILKSLYHNLVPQSIQENIAKPDANPGGTPVTHMFGRAYDELGLRLNELAQKHPEAMKEFESVLKTTQGAGDISGGILTGEGAAQGIDALTKAPKVILDKADEAGSAIKNMVSGSPEAQATEQAGSDLQKIKETISPKPTVKEAKNALDQGRLYKGSEPTLFKSGTPDHIATSEQQLKSTMTIQKNIPGASEMDGPTLHQALDEHITAAAQKIQPQMEATPLKPETVQKIGEDIANLHKEQLLEAKATDEPNITKWQNNFKKIVDKNLTDGENLNNVWDAAKEYDASIKANVKNATELSSEDLQTQKDIWLQNRAILRGALTDAENGLGGEAKKVFSEMRDMYEAQNGIMSKAKVETAVKPSKVVQFTKDHPNITKAAGSLVGLEGARKFVTGSF